jgi:hypothetical protein
MPANDLLFNGQTIAVFSAGTDMAGCPVRFIVKGSVRPCIVCHRDRSLVARYLTTRAFHFCILFVGWQCAVVTELPRASRQVSTPDRIVPASVSVHSCGGNPFLQAVI